MYYFIEVSKKKKNFSLNFIVDENPVYVNKKACFQYKSSIFFEIRKKKIIIPLINEKLFQIFFFEDFHQFYYAWAVTSHLYMPFKIDPTRT